MTEQPTIEKRYAHEIAPEPEWDWDTQVPIETHLRSLLARAAAYQNTVTELMQRQLDGDVLFGQPTYFDAVERYTAVALTALTLLGTTEGKTVEQALNDAHNALCAGDVAAELIWLALKARGIDQDTIKPYLPRWYVPELVIEGLGDDDETRYVMARGHHERAAFHAAAATFLDVTYVDMPPVTDVEHVWATLPDVEDAVFTWKGVTPRTEDAFAATLLRVDGRVPA